MYIKKDFDFSDLKDNSWNSATDTLMRIEEENKEDELMQLLEEIFTEVPSETEVNDLLWHDPEYVYYKLGIEGE